MEELTPAQQLPLLYRSALDVVARLEEAGDRQTGYDIRRRATQTYSTRWDEGGRRSLQRLVREGEQRLATRSAISASALSGAAEPA
ncbi:MAG: hypothetical protein WCK58_13295 [Chloroflexota bacterium]